MATRINVLALRERLGVGQSEFAKMIGASERSVRRWETDTIDPSPLARKELQRLSDEADAKAQQTAVRRRAVDEDEKAEGTPPRRSLGVPSQQT